MHPPLSSLQLEAFMAVAQEQSFSKAAEVVHLSQSALSQRILNLEEELQTTLFIRQHTGTTLTSAGQNLLRFCRSKMILEKEFRQQLQQTEQGFCWITSNRWNFNHYAFYSFYEALKLYC